MHALKVLEFDAIRRRLLSHCETPLGGESCLELLPSYNADEVWHLLDLTNEAYDALAKHSVPSLGAVRDMRSALKRANKGGVLGGQELYRVGAALAAMRLMKSFLSNLAESLPNLAPYGEALPDHQKVESQLLESFESDGTMLDTASPALGSLRQRKKGASARILERIQSYTTGKTRDLLSDPIYTVRDGRYVVPLKAENRGKIKGIVHDMSGSGQTIYVEPEDVVQLSNALREIEAAERTEEHRILTQFSTKVGSIGADITGGIEAASRLDVIFAKARLAYEMKSSMPQRLRNSTAYIKVHGGRHPLLAAEKVVPLDIEVGRGSSVLITGPNTGGKTVAIKCVGLFVLMSQCGMFCPALDVRLAPFSQVWADIGDEQSLQQSLSTFSGHIKNISESLRKLKDGAIVLLDEIGAGTDPAEGAALAKSVLESMVEKGATILASTHYGELKAFAYSHPQFSNAAMEFDQKTFQPTYRLMMGAPGASQALRIAERYGIPKDIIEKARAGLGAEAIDMARMLEQLENSQKQARNAQSEADRRTGELKKAEERAARKLAEAEEIRKTAHSKANETIESVLRELRLEASKLFEDLKKAPHDPQVQDRVRRGLRDLDGIGRDFAKEFVPKADPKLPAADVRKGSIVRVTGHMQTGTAIEDPRNGKVMVQVGMLKMTVPVNQLEVLKSHTDQPAKPKSNIRLQKTMTATTELHLRHMRAEEAIRDLERFLDDAVLGNVPMVRIVHGKGGGVLRKITQDYLRTHPAVSSYRDGEPAEGGQGVTIASFT